MVAATTSGATQTESGTLSRPGFITPLDPLRNPARAGAVLTHDLHFAALEAFGNHDVQGFVAGRIRTIEVALEQHLGSNRYVEGTRLVLEIDFNSQFPT